VQQDYFQPYNYQALNAAGRDFGSAGVTLLDSDVFKGRNVRNIAISGGKSGRLYIMNGDDLGGFANGSSPIQNSRDIVLTMRTGVNGSDNGTYFHHLLILFS
jgi:hypothetical protein